MRGRREAVPVSYRIWASETRLCWSFIRGPGAEAGLKRSEIDAFACIILNNEARYLSMFRIRLISVYGNHSYQ